MGGKMISYGTSAGYGDRIDDDQDPTTPPNPTVRNLRVTGSWTDTATSADGIQSGLGYGGTLNLSVDGGTVEFKGSINLGKGNYDQITNEGMDGNGNVYVENGGSFKAQTSI